MQNSYILKFAFLKSLSPRFKQNPLGVQLHSCSLSAMLCGSPFALVVVGRPEIILAVHVEVACKKRRKIDVIPDGRREVNKYRESLQGRSQVW